MVICTAYTTFVSHATGFKRSCLLMRKEGQIRRDPNQGVSEGLVSAVC